MTRALEAIFTSAEATGFLHACDIDDDASVSINADEPVVLASVFKIPVLLELTRRASAGDLDLTDRVRVPAGGRTLGPTGLSVMHDEIDISLRDLAYLMMSVSDNTATDVIMRMVGVDRINETLRELGLEHTHLVGDCDVLLSSFSEDTGLEAMPTGGFATMDPDVLNRWRSLDPPTTSRSTPREIAKLVSMIWRDEAGPPAACAEVRRIMAHQVWPHRLTQGFPDGVSLAAKTGTLPGIRNEAGVATFPDGKRYAVAVFTRAATYADRQPAIDTAIGRAAYAAVRVLRGEVSLDDR